MKRYLILCLLLLLAGVRPGWSVDSSVPYSLKIRGITVGAVMLTSKADDKTYAVSGVIENSGLTRIFRQFSYRGSSRGRVADTALSPDRYQEAADTGRRSSEAVIEYIKGVPHIVRYTSDNEAGADTPDPATQGGTVDPLTAIYALLRDIPRDQACRLDIAIFDGKRRSRIFTRPAAQVDGLPTCTGQYQRLQGFTAKEVSRHRKFDFVLTYSDAGNGMLRVQNVAFDSFYGTATIERR